MSNGFNTDGIFTCPETESPEMNCLESIECTIAFDVKDWSVDRRNAWIYGIVFGWDEDSLKTLSFRFHWDSKDIDRLKRYHYQWENLKLKMEDDKQ